MGGDLQGSAREAQHTREVGREGLQDPRETEIVCLDATFGGADKSAQRSSWVDVGRSVVTLVDVQRAYFYVPSRRRVFVELPPVDYQAGDEHRCGLLQYSLYVTRDAAQRCEEELASTLSGIEDDERNRVPMWKSCINGEHFETTVQRG